MTSKNALLKLQQTLYTSKNPTRRWLHCTRRDWIIDAIYRYSHRGNEKALEIGPGCGVYLPTLGTLFQEVTAIDIEDTFLINAKALSQTILNINLLDRDIMDSKLPDSSFDLILCSEVIEHLAKPTAAIREIRRLLRPSGILILSTPQRYSLIELTSKVAFLPGIIDLVRWVYHEPILETGHINLLTERQVIEQLKTSAFKLLERFKSGMYLPLVAEFVGPYGLRIEKWLESRLRYRPLLNGLLWEQYYIAEIAEP